MTTTTAAPAVVQPWDRRDAETDVAWAAFVVYRDLPPAQRSLRAAGAVLGKAESLLSRWSSKHEWVARAAAKDRDDDRNNQSDARATTKEKRDKVLESQYTAGAALLQRGLAALQKVDPATLKPADIPRYVVAAVSLMRQSVGLPDRILGDQESVEDVEVGPIDRLSVEEKRARMVLLQREVERRVKATMSGAEDEE